MSCNLFFNRGKLIICLLKMLVNECGKELLDLLQSTFSMKLYRYITLLVENSS